MNEQGTSFREREKSPLSVPAFLFQGCSGYLQKREDLADAERFCLFVGYPRSGHSLLGSLLNAHPEVVIAHEVNVLRYLRYGFPRQALLGLLLRRDQEYGSQGRSGSGYDYSVPGQYQGTYQRLRVIGDKRGRASSKYLGRNPRLLQRLKRVTNLPLRVIHHVRNPFDNIATMAHRGNDSLETATDRYFRLAGWATDALDTLAPEEFVHSYHEAVINNPEAELRRLTGFLGIDAHEDYIRACAGQVFSSPRRSRDSVEWNQDLIARIEEQVAAFPHLRGYSFST